MDIVERDRLFGSYWPEIESILSSIRLEGFCRVRTRVGVKDHLIDVTADRCSRSSSRSEYLVPGGPNDTLVIDAAGDSQTVHCTWTRTWQIAPRTERTSAT